MKKFLALFFALILALTSFTVAFASKADLTCDDCYAKLANDTAYDAHVNGGCPVAFKTCEFCSSKIHIDNEKAHLGVCPLKSECQYCAKALKLTDVATHEAACTKNPDVTAPEEEKDQYVCDVCHSIFTDEATYKTHANSTCLEAYKDCPYCAAKVATDDLDDHKADCPKGACKCDYCGEDFDTQGDYDLHIEACESKYFKIPVSKILDKIVEFFKGINWGDLVDKVSGFIKGIDFEGLFGDVKKLVGDIDFEGIFGDIEGALGGLIPSEKK